MAKSQKDVKRYKKSNRINYKERIIIENRYCVDKKSISEIAKELGRHITTISREIAGKPRIGRGKYNADSKQAKAISNSEK